MLPTLCIVGLGYVGLPLAHAFAKAGYNTIGLDVNKERITELMNRVDKTRELSPSQLQEVEMKIKYSSEPWNAIDKADIIIVAIPTPVTKDNKPDLHLLEVATMAISEFMKDGAIIVYESTVYPGVTEELCGGILKKSGKRFHLGYSPERVNPGDTEHTITNIVKVVAGEDEKTTDALCALYGSIITAGIHRAPSIKVAEMAKAIENAQRDLNVAYVNEIAKLCERLGIRTKDVLDAAGTKWNFLKFSPGLVGGHCIGVDPYYLLEKATMLGTSMPIVTAARETNDGMASYVAERIVQVIGTHAAVLVLGLTFKENVPDERNSKTPEVIKHLRAKGCEVATHDPYVTPEQLLEGSFDAILLLVPHREYLAMKPHDLAKVAKKKCLFYDLKSVMNRAALESEGFTYMAL